MQKTKDHVVLLGFSDFGLGRGLYIAEAFSLMGQKVTIITNKPIYNSSQKSSRDFRPSFDAKVIEIRIPFAQTLYSSLLGRLVVYVTFSVLCLFRLFMINPRPNIIYSRSPNGPFTDISSIIFSWFCHNLILVSDITDLLPDCLEYVDMNNLLRRMLILLGGPINYLIYSKIHRIITLNEIFGKILQERFKRDVHVIYGAIDLDRFKPLNKQLALKVLPQTLSSIVASKFVVLYAGVMSAFQNTKIVVDIAEQIQDECSDIVFVVIGSGPLKQELKNIVQKKSLNNVLILEAVSHELMPFVYNIADFCFFPPPLLAVSGMYEYFRITLPKKFIEYAASGKPILCITPPCVASKLCLKWNAGYHILPQNLEEAVDIIKLLKEDKNLKEKLGKNARQLAENLFSLDYVAKTLKKIIIG